MAELILTEAEKTAATWFELDDATLGKVVKRTAAGLLTHSEEMGRIWWFAAALLLCGQAKDANAETLTVNVDGFTDAGQELGDWEVTVRRIKPSNIKVTSARAEE